MYQGPLSHLRTFFVVSHDDADGRLVLDDGRLKVRWPNVAEQSVYKRVDEALTKVADTVGGRYIKYVGSFGPPKLILQLHLDYADGTSTVVASGPAWKVATGPITFSCTYGGEDYDADLLSTDAY